MPEDQESQTQAPETDAQQDDFDKARAMETIRKLREFEKTAKQQAKELETLRAQAKQAEDAKLSESERLTKRVAELETQAQEREKAIEQQSRVLSEARRTALVARLAGTLGARDASDANILAATAGIDPSAETAETDARRAIETLKKSKPYLFQSGGGVEPFNPPAGGGSAGESDAQRRARLYSGGGNVLDPQNARARGGGVYISHSPDEVVR